MDLFTAFGFVAVSCMLVCYALEMRSEWYVLGFSASCVAAAVYAYIQGAAPIAAVELVWSVVSGLRWYRRHRMARHTRERFTRAQARQGRRDGK